MQQTISAEIKLEEFEGIESLQSLHDLFRSLERNGVRYCHWKSNLRLDKSLNGETDFDLLLDKRHKLLFNKILADHGVKPIKPEPEKEYPGIENFLGFDAQRGILFHLHIHYQLVLGEQFVKNYSIPIEEIFLDNTQLEKGVRIVFPELELIILSIRALLKYRDRDMLRDILSIRTSGIPDAIGQEIFWLLQQTSNERISQFLEVLHPFLPVEIIQEFLQVFVNSPRNGFKFFSLRSQLRKALRQHQRQARIKNTYHYFRIIFKQAISQFRKIPSKKMTIKKEGITIALVGADGSGKSTTSALLTKWLSWKLKVKLLYLGSKQPSLLSKILYIFFRITRKIHRFVSRWLSRDSFFVRIIDNFHEICLYCHDLSLGWDRYKRYRSGLRYASAGYVVIFDRYPLTALLDGPRIQPPTASKEIISRLLYNFEKNIYKRIAPPEACIVLQVRPETALNRKPDHDPDKVKAKCNLIFGLEDEYRNEKVWHFFPILADLPKDEVFHQIKKIVWSIL